MPSGEVTPGTISNATARVGQRLGLFAAAAEHERIAALQPHHVQPAPRALDQHGADLFLREARASDFFLPT